FRWTAGTGMVGLGDLPGSVFNSGAYGVSGDGSVVVGWGTGSNGVEAALWTAGTGMVSLGQLPALPHGSGAFAISSDGSVVVGWSWSGSGGIEAFRWDAGTGMVGLGDLPGGTFFSQARAVSGDGSVVVGEGHSDNGQEAFIWDAKSGMRRLADVLVSDYGLDLGGFVLRSALGISGDGQVIVGCGINGAGQEEAWIASLRGASLPPPTVPAPPSILLMALGLAALGCRLRAG
ncbi:MAG: PEP-CTERM sorting domain-containing protein, partial [Gammaproteobacteria bacterium]